MSRIDGIGQGPLHIPHTSSLTHSLTSASKTAPDSGLTACTSCPSSASHFRQEQIPEIRWARLASSQSSSESPSVKHRGQWQFLWLSFIVTVVVVGDFSAGVRFMLMMLFGARGTRLRVRCWHVNIWSTFRPICRMWQPQLGCFAATYTWATGICGLLLRLWLRVSARARQRERESDRERGRGREREEGDPTLN